MSGPLIAAQVVAAGAQLWASEKASKAQFAAAQRQQSLFKLQEDRMQARADEQSALRRGQGRQTRSLQGTIASYSGRDVGGHSVQNAMRYELAIQEREVASIQREAQFQKNMIRMQAEFQLQAARDQRKADKFNNWAKFIGAGAQAGGQMAQLSALSKNQDVLLGLEQQQDRIAAYKAGEYSGIQAAAESEFGRPAAFDYKTGEFYPQGTDTLNFPTSEGTIFFKARGRK